MAKEQPIELTPEQLTLTQVLLRPAKVETDLWAELARANGMSLAECIRTAMAEAAGKPEIYDAVKLAMKAEKQQRARDMQSKRWVNKKAPPVVAAIDPGLDEPLPAVSPLDEPLAADVDDSLDAPFED